MNSISLALQSARAEAEAAYVARNPRSAEALRVAAAVMPGGNTRSVLFYPPFPLAMARGEGAFLWDADGHRYIDFLGEFTAGLFGHSHPVILAAIREALGRGMNFGAHNLVEAGLARVICERFPSIEQVRFTNSGTEANLLAIALAKAATGRGRLLCFNGGYHGGVLAFGPVPSPVNVPHDVALSRYNDTAQAVTLIRANADTLAAVIVEPMLGSGGCIPAEPAFLQALREATREVDALLIFDEVMTSRTSSGGRQKLLGIVPDITTLGKYIGGGMSFGAFGAGSKLMALFDPRRPGALAHAGTFNNNVLTMSAGFAGMTKVFTPEAADGLFLRGEALREALNAACREAGAAMQFTGLGSMMNVHFTDRPIRAPEDAPDDGALKELFFFTLLEAGIYIARRGMIALPLPLGEAETVAMVTAVRNFLARYRLLLGAAG